jgi:cysteine desulfurase
MIYLDHHATTPMDPIVRDAMLPYFCDHFANPGSTSHEAGRFVAERVEEATATIASAIGSSADEILFTSGATESINLAIFGSMLHPREKRRQIISVVSEHRATLDPLLRLQKQDREVILIPVAPQSSSVPGQIDLDQLKRHLSEQTALVSVMLANNEIGTIQPIAQIAELCARYSVPLHCDAAQAVGRLPVDVDSLNVDLMSFSAHKFYGPKGVGGLYIRRRPRSTRLFAQIVGGGQQHNLRSGTLNAPGIIGMAAALRVSLDRLTQDHVHAQQLRDQLWTGLQHAIPEIQLNGPSLSDSEQRLVANLNCAFPGVEGQSLMLAVPELCVSSGSACTSAEPHPSHVLLSLGLDEGRVRSSLRFGIGRFNSPGEIDLAVQLLAQGYRKLVGLG